MAFRCVLNRAKSWSVKGAISRFVCTNVNPTLGRRYYHLPPPPSLENRACCLYCWPVSEFDEEFQKAISNAKFAVAMHNDIEGRNIKFTRLVRASEFRSSYYLTVEGIDENGDRNVYYAEVQENPAKWDTWLKRWELIDDAFRYPYTHTMKHRKDIFPDDCTDYFRMMSKFEEHVCPNSHDFPAADSVVEVCNIVELKEALHHALHDQRPVESQKQSVIHLQKLLHASMINIKGNIYYYLLVEAIHEQTHELKLYYTLMRTCGERFVKWKEVDN